MSDDLREVLAEHMEIPLPWMQGYMQVDIDQMLAALRQVEQRAFERAAQVADYQTRVNVQARRDRADDELAFQFQGLGDVIATAIRALSTPSLIRESTKGGGL